VEVKLAEAPARANSWLRRISDASGDLSGLRSVAGKASSSRLRKICTFFKSGPPAAMRSSLGTAQQSIMMWVSRFRFHQQPYSPFLSTPIRKPKSGESNGVWTPFQGLVGSGAVDTARYK